MSHGIVIESPRLPCDIGVSFYGGGSSVGVEEMPLESPGKSLG